MDFDFAALNALVMSRAYELSALANGVAWFAWCLTFVRIARRSKGSEQNRDSTSLIGLALKGIGLLCVLVWFRPFHTPLLPSSENYQDPAQLAITLSAMVLEFSAVFLTTSALKALGRQWAYAARILDDHKLIQSGAYSLVRHPIYTSMLFLNVATALTFAFWPGVVVTTLFSALGTWIRVRSEERLMHQAFGREFESYAASVPAIVPWLKFPGRAVSGG